MNEKKILVVDDEIMILDLLKEFFSSAGYAVLTAYSAEEALNILKGESVLVLFLDVNLTGMSGIDLCKELRKENNICIIYALTGDSNISNLLKCRTAGFDDFFVKPAKTDLLLKAAQEAFEKLERWEITSYGLT